MPLYTFKCTACEYTKDYLEKFGVTETACVKCGEVAKKELSFKFVATGLPNGHHSIRSKCKTK